MRIAAVLLALTLLCHVPGASAQTPGPHFGVKLGPTFANVSVDPEDPGEHTGTRWGIGGGGFGVMPLTPRIAVQVEALFTPKGASSEGADRLWEAHLLASFALFDNDPSKINALEDGFAAVTPEQLMKAASEWLRPTNRTIYTVIPGAAGNN